MKKYIVWGMALILLGASCRKDEPHSPEQPPKEEQPSVQPPKPSEESKDESKSSDPKPTDPKPGEQSDQATTKPENRPEDYTLAKRLTVQWRAEEATYLKALPFEAFWAERKQDAIQLKQLLPLIQVSSSKVDGSVYSLSESERQALKLEQLSYEDTSSESGYLLLKLSYKGVSSETLRLPFDRRAYFKQLVSLNKGFAAQHYLGGVYEYLEVYLGELLSYDKDKYALQLMPTSKQQSLSSGSLSFQVRMTRLGTTGDEALALLDYEVSGFKPLKQLASELVIAHKSELGAKLSSLLRRDQTNEQMLTRLKVSQGSWLREEFIQFGLKKGQSLISLTWDEGKRLLYGGNEQRGAARDLYLTMPRFELRSVEQEGTHLILRIALVGVDELALDADSPVLELRVVGFRPQA